MKCENCKLNGKIVPKCRVGIIPKNGECYLDDSIGEQVATIDEKVGRLNDEIEKLVEDFEEEIENRLGEGFAKVAMEIKKLLKVIGE